MTDRLVSVAFVVALILSIVAASPASAGPVPRDPAVFVLTPVAADTGPSIAHGRSSDRGAPLRDRPLMQPGGSAPGGGAVGTADTSVQTSATTPLGSISGLSFDGVGVGLGGYTDCCAPPDTNASVGATQVVQWVNLDFAVFAKATGALLQGPTAGNAIWSGFAGGNCATNNDGDPVVKYDAQAQRWFMTQFSVTGGPPYYQCIAVSSGADFITSTWARYAYSFGANFPDYPKAGVWSDAYYMSFNLFANGRTFAGAGACAFDRTKMLAANLTATGQCFQLATSYGGLLPSDLDGATGAAGSTAAPPAGAPNTFANFGTNVLNLWKFHVDFANSANTTFTGPTALGVPAFSTACGGGVCIPQARTTNQLDSLGDRLMYRLAYRHFADGHESLVVNHSVAVGGGLFSSGVSSVRWYELRNAAGWTIGTAPPVVYQQGTLGTSDSIHRWMGSAAMDQNGDIALGYSASNSSVYPSIRYTGRTPGDPLNTMETETIVKAGSGSQLQNLSRWGDYSAMTVDPVDDCTFWYTTEYLKASGTWNWSTWITSFRFPGCGSPVVPDFTISATPTSQSVPAGTSGLYSVSVALTGSAGAVTLVAGGIPPGASASFAPDPTTSSSTMTITTSATTTPGTYPIVITGTSGGVTHTTSVDLVVTAPAATPSAPQGVTAVPASGKGVQVAWSPPATDGGSAISGYVIYRGTTLTTLAPLTTIGNVTGYKDTSTLRGRTYYYAVSAINAVGEGTLSTVVGPVKAK